MSQEATIALFVLSVTLQTGAIFPFLLYILSTVRATEHRLAKIEGALECRGPISRKK